MASNKFLRLHRITKDVPENPSVKYVVKNTAGETMGYVSAKDENEAYHKAKIKFGGGEFTIRRVGG